MRFISFNVNGLRAIKQKNFDEFFKSIDADFFCIQETKMQEGQLDISIDGYYAFLNSAIKKGYSGTLLYTKHKPLSVSYGMNGKYNDEGRIITLEYNDFYLVTCYVPNSQEELKRLDYRMQFEDDMRMYLKSLDNKKPVIYCGDLNVAHNPIDIKNPTSNERNAGYTIEERTKLTELLNEGFIDTFRFMNQNIVKYSWWSYRFFAREKNIGWRIDYFLVSKILGSRITKADILTDVYGSDHCPVLLEIDI
ncbi:MAG: exodeoxyribonuclease III [Anaeroplasmataceae bacterium]